MSRKSSTREMRDAALDYARRGLAVFPLYEPLVEGGCSCAKKQCDKPGKHPRTAYGFKDATIDPAQIRRWWKQYPHANIGMATGAEPGLWVLDVDCKDGGLESLDALTAEHGQIGDVATVRTASGGKHLYFRHPGHPVKTRSGIVPGIDVRGDGGYVVAPPSLHRTGARYARDPISSEAEPLQEAPEWLLQLVSASRKSEPLTAGTPSLERSSPAGTSKIPEGRRNDNLTRIAGSLRRIGLNEGGVYAGLVALNYDLCEQSLEDGELRSIARSIASRPLSDFGPVEQGGRGELLMYTVEQLRERPPIEWTIGGILPKDSVCVLSGAPGHGKSFLALDRPLCIAGGLEWCGHWVIPGYVLYIAAEGERGYRVRVDSWLTARPGCRVDQFLLVPEAVQPVEQDDLNRLLEPLRKLPGMPQLVVLDTLARCFGGGEENSTRDMGRMVDAADQIRRLTGGTVLIVHHTGKDGSLRGSTARPAAVSTVVAVKKDKAGLAVSCAKQKDGEEFDRMNFRLRQVEASCILESVASTPPQTDGLKPALLNRLSALKSGGLRFKEWKNIGGPEGSFGRNRNVLLEEGFVVECGGVYELTDKGRAVLGPAPGQQSVATDHTSGSSPGVVQSTTCGRSRGKSKTSGGGSRQ